MQLWEEIAIQIMENDPVIIPPQDFTELVQTRCYRALTQIRNILRDENLSDQACHLQIEQVIRALEELGSDAQYRHEDHTD